MNLPSTLKCPRDDSHLRPGMLREVLLHGCGVCKGILIEQPQLDGLARTMIEELMKTITLDQMPTIIPDKGASVPCPKCHRHMDNHGYMESRVVMIDHCSSCNVLWLDTDELGAVAELYARTHFRSEIKRLAAVEAERNSRRQMSTAAFHRAIEKFVTGGLT